MKIAIHQTRRARTLTLAVVTAITLLCAVALGVEVGVGASILALVVGGITVAIIKSVFEFSAATEQLRAEVGQLTDRSRQTKRAAERHASAQQTFNDAIINRVRHTEQHTTTQQTFNDAIINRVRHTEQHTTTQDTFNDAIINRIRNIEHAIGETGPDDETWMHPSRARSRPGRTRRLSAVRDQIEQATNLISPDDQHDVVGQPVDAPAAPRAPRSSETPLVSVVVTCFNQERYIHDAVASVLQQSYANLECIVVDDASTDRSIDRIEEAIASDRRGLLVRNRENLEVSGARTVGLEAANGVYVAFLDGDDLMMRSSVQDRIDALLVVDDPDLAGSYTDFQLGDPGTTLSELPDRYPMRSAAPFVDFLTARGECPFGTPGPLLRSDVVRGVGGWSREFDHAEDWELWNRILRHGFYFVPAASRTILYRQLGESKAQKGAIAHVANSERLIEQAYEPMHHAAAATSASIIFDRPLWYYDVLVSRTRRVIQSGAMVLLGGDIDAFDQIVDTLPGGTWPLIKRHVDIDRHAADGFRRAAGLDPDEFAMVSDSMQVLLRHVRACVHRSTG